MTTPLDIRVMSSAAAALDRVGVTCRVTINAGAVDVATGGVSVSQSSIDIVGSPPVGYAEERIDGDLVMRGDAEVILKPVDISGDAWSPDPERMSLSFPNSNDGNVWKIISFKPITAGDDVAVYQIQLRR